MAQVSNKDLSRMQSEQFQQSRHTTGGDGRSL